MGWVTEGIHMSRLAACVSLALLCAGNAGATPAVDDARFGVRRLGSAQRGVFVDASHDIVAVRWPAPPPQNGARDAASVATDVERLLNKLGVAVAVVDSRRVTAHGTVAVTLSRPVERATLSALERLVNTEGGLLWPVLVRGPGISADLPREPLENLDRAPRLGRAFADDHLVVVAEEGKLETVLGAVLAKTDGTLVKRSRWLKDTALVQVGAAVHFDAVDAAARVASLAFVRSAEPNLYRELAPRDVGTGNDPLLARQWHLSRDQEPAASVPGVGEIFAPEAWALSRGDPAVVAAVFDSGTDWAHPDLVDNVREDLMFDATDGDNDPGPECQSRGDGVAVVEDCPGNAPYVESHGTAVSGTIAARGENGLGGSGVCPECSLLPVRLLGESTTPSLTTAEAFARACDPFSNGTGEGAWLINNSWGPGFSLYFPLSTAERDAFELCRTVGRGGRGTVILFAAGNETSNVRKDAYAKHPSVISVAASTNLDDWAAYSNYGDEIDVAAPSMGGTVTGDNYGIVTTDVRGGERGYSVSGTDVDNTDIDVDYTDGFSGTSAACPVAAGVVGLILSVNPELTAEQVRLVLTRSADKIEANQVDWLSIIGQDLRAIFAYDDVGHSIGFGYGRVNAEAAVTLAGSTELGRQGAACVVGDGTCEHCEESLSRCFLPCTTQDDCDDGAVCGNGLCQLPVERPGDFLSPCDDEACPLCVTTVDTQFLTTAVCSKECSVDADCDPACKDDPANCEPDGFDCRPATDDPRGPLVCAIGDPSAGGPADFGACFNRQIGTSVVVTSGEGRSLCGDLCFDDAPSSCAYGFHCADVACECTRDSRFGCFEYTCTEVSPNAANFFFPVCVPDPGHGDECTSDFDCQLGDYCAESDAGPGHCRIDDRAGCDICKPCNDSSECGGRGTCIGTNNGENPGVCSVACDDGEPCPGNSECRELITRRGTIMACLGTIPSFADDDTALDLCVDFVCEVDCRDDVPCDDGLVCKDGTCVAQGDDDDDQQTGDEDNGDATTIMGCASCQAAGGDASLGLGLALASLLVRRRRRR
jgi:subtilisin family serine protease